VESSGRNSMINYNFRHRRYCWISESAFMCSGSLFHK